ncbi:hypothetical protein FQN57_001165 [Myotisia sp. PD_48]|nr:hypothetical protein FQN57_001165 [Myotisia sp. PD_48]
MWLFRGAQSAIFYYVACTPCTAHQQRRKRKKDANKTLRDDPSRDILVTDQPALFHQPFPFSTNTYWKEEICLGPGPPSRRGLRNGASRTGSQRNLSSPEKPIDATVLSTRLEEFPRLPHKKERESLKDSLGDRWNRIRYQREDEVLWGMEIKGSSVGLSGRGRASTAGSSKYCTARNPDVNDLHPPIVCGPKSKEETRWMLQPPPSAKVMAGKIRSNLSSNLSISGSPRKFANPHLSPNLSIPGGEIEEFELLNLSLTHGSAVSCSSKALAISPSVSCPRPSIPRSIDSPSNTTANLGHNLNTASNAQTNLHPLPEPPRSPLSTIFSSPGSKDVHALSPSLSSNPGLNPPLLSQSSEGSKTCGSQSSWKPEEGIEDRPSSKETTDSGKAFHPATPSTLLNHSDTHLTAARTSPVRLGDHDHKNYLDIEDMRPLQQIRSNRWSMDI